MNPQQLSHELRFGNTPDLIRRRWIIALSMVGAGMGIIVSLYQTGIIRHLPDPPLPFFDSDRVDASNYAYSRLQTPDGLMMVTNYAITAWLAGAGGLDRAQSNPLLPIAMGIKLLFDAATAALLPPVRNGARTKLFVRTANLRPFVHLHRWHLQYPKCLAPSTPCKGDATKRQSSSFIRGLLMHLI